MTPIISNRIEKTRAALAKNDLDGLMVSVQENRFYLSGFTGEDTQFDESAGVLIITPTRLVLATDSRYDLQAKSEAAGYEVVIYKKGLEQELPGIADSLGIRRMGFESARLSHKQYAAFAKALNTVSPPMELVPTENLIENLRKIKSDDEVARTVSALRLAEKAFVQVLDGLRPGLTEKQVAWSMEKAMREAGAQGLSFPVIVASGPNSALPHAIPTDRPLSTGEPILFDWGARLNEYCSDTTRTVVMGQPDDRFRKVFDTVVTARDKATAAIRAGASGMDVDRVARDYIHSSGFVDRFGHSLGHGTGLAVHESPRLSPIKDERLETGMIVTVEPGIYLPGWGGIRMENQVVVAEDGARVLNDPAPFDPILKI
ncbi:M24 family metallopeptidase [Desulfosarcina ovata]|uniref:Aminopeptidase n=2 Tax=Desulfosarcina ovata TaxID=83564 RepID=A0A5K8A472_9BACT|nr:Xaa-Pro peptidase family protein [Desulfosarcina ovata]BBO80005.1 aminopeptidase [Desulfosarcina ovata subsp. sediminis]BBO87319.1 aminopeptidase [Desulfosarcina ovata subsp. ovata]